MRNVFVLNTHQPWVVTTRGWRLLALCLCKAPAWGMEGLEEESVGAMNSQLRLLIRQYWKEGGATGSLRNSHLHGTAENYSLIRERLKARSSCGTVSCSLWELPWASCRTNAATSLFHLREYCVFRKYRKIYSACSSQVPRTGTYQGCCSPCKHTELWEQNSREDCRKQSIPPAESTAPTSSARCSKLGKVHVEIKRKQDKRQAWHPRGGNIPGPQNSDVLWSSLSLNQEVL